MAFVPGGPIAAPPLGLHPPVLGPIHLDPGLMQLSILRAAGHPHVESDSSFLAHRALANPAISGGPRPGDLLPPVPIQPRPVDQGFGNQAADLAAQHQAMANAIAQSGRSPSPINSDQQLANQMAAHLHNALAAVRDPELRTSLATAMAALHKHIAGIHKEHQQALQGKVSPRLMSLAYGGGHATGSVL